MAWHLYCPKCGWRGNKEEYTHKCPICGSPLELKGELPRTRNILGEGKTPLIKISNVNYKLDYLNPTGSFKDRGTSTSVQIAEKLGYECITEDSSGNTGISVAAYSSRLGLKPIIHVPATITPGKARLIRILGGELIIHETRQAAAIAAEKDSKKCFYVAHAYSPIFLEGIASITEEIEDHVDKPIIVPVSSGTLLLGIYRGLLKRGKQPQIIAAQAAEAFSLQGKTKLLARTASHISRLADALVMKNPPRITEMAKAAKGVVVVGDPEIMESWPRLLRLGLIVEPSSAVAEAAREMLSLSRALVVLTGSGLKYVEGSGGLDVWRRGRDLNPGHGLDRPAY